MLGSLPDGLFLHRAAFDDDLSRAARDAELKLAAPIRKAILSALSERNAEAQICRDRDGPPSPTQSCATPRTCRSVRMSSRSSSAR